MTLLVVAALWVLGGLNEVAHARCDAAIEYVEASFVENLMVDALIVVRWPFVSLYACASVAATLVRR